MGAIQSAFSSLAPGRRVFRSLGYRNFRLFFMGQGISLIGTWMQMIAAGWLAYELTADEPERVRAFWLGVVAALLAMTLLPSGRRAVTGHILQNLVDDHMRGRVMSFYSMAFMGMVPLGSLLAGLMARLAGAPLTVLLNGLGCIVGSLLFFRQLPAMRRQLHPVYARKGIVPASARSLPR